ncbi:MAG: hypothetical protein RI932_1979, partial [Pseudomonadota bacterium]
MTPASAMTTTVSITPKRAALLVCFIFALSWLPSSFAESKAKKLQLVGAIVSARGGVALVKNRDTSEVKAF